MLTRRPLVALSFALPALLLYSVIVIYPLFSGAYLSLTDSSGGPKADFVGLDNYVRLFGDGDVWDALRVTLLYAVVVVVFQNLFGLLLARGLYNRPRARKIVTAFVLLPSLVAPVMAAFIFSYIFAPEGALNSFLGAIGLDSLQRVWLGDPSTALFAVAAVNIWGFAGYSGIIYLAGYSAIDKDVLNAAAIDGASGFSRFRYIEWPLITPALTVNLALNVIGALRVFELPLVMTNGGPANSTTTITMLIYRNLFGSAGGFAYATALAVFFLLLVVVVAVTMTTLLRARERRMF
ncbi:sugar ABC transporter permease [Herbiconiux sp. CPCC 205716]|uniref:Sugar ABC transporter permease n=1 Tax=Herbiconiux gentiana TaxID=2970912 RepID=A0ABT2GAE5_9MICO|nr:sugar ABC transporter permease [Herbiconiux gentiana]MCS5713170.1 sugar ABC transporter permease [Herbiconiux gentiana]